MRVRFVSVEIDSFAETVNFQSGRGCLQGETRQEAQVFVHSACQGYGVFALLVFGLLGVLWGSFS